ncbi:MAG: hypothetical protein ACM3OO_10015 [Planctomycetaceae bacterium]
MSQGEPTRRQDHHEVLDELLDLQARLRGDPSSVALASRPVPVDAEHRVIVRRRDLTVTHDPEPTAAPSTSTGDRRVEDLLARMDRLERTLQSMISRLDGVAPRGPGWTERDDQVRTLQRTAHERLRRSS